MKTRKILAKAAKLLNYAPEHTTFIGLIFGKIHKPYTKQCHATLCTQSA